MKLRGRCIDGQTGLLARKVIILARTRPPHAWYFDDS
jgi:hypothetical protein